MTPEAYFAHKIGLTRFGPWMGVQAPEGNRWRSFKDCAKQEAETPKGKFPLPEWNDAPFNGYPVPDFRLFSCDEVALPSFVSMAMLIAMFFGALLLLFPSINSMMLISSNMPA